MTRLGKGNDKELLPSFSKTSIVIHNLSLMNLLFFVMMVVVVALMMMMVVVIFIVR